MLSAYDNASLDTPIKLRPTAYDQILIDGLTYKASIGIFPHEYTQKQKIRIDLVMDVNIVRQSESYEKETILRYDHVVNDISNLIRDSHFELVETLAEKITQLCFAYESVKHVNITVTKLEAIKNAKNVGVRFQRERAI